ncbi:MAG: hypothetical protein HKN70_05280 [Gammaproteobacteria bacterium]|nr:hypothetical protein [Gammaproteobacteria bacterium]
MRMNKRHQRFLLTVAGFGFLLCACQESPSGFSANYAGQEQLAIKSLSDDDMRQLKNGEGWGLAKVAELNGMPGPAHLLQMKRQIELTADQERRIQLLFDEMKVRAIALGHQLIDLEAQLNTSFADGTVTTASLDQQLRAIADVRRALRFAHLETHLKTPDILTTRQVAEYNRLRGYSSGDPCSHVPEGHDEEMWKRHNDCQ